MKEVPIVSCNTYLQSSFLGEEVSLKRMNNNRPISMGCSLHITDASSQPEVDKIFELIQLVREEKSTTENIHGSRNSVCTYLIPYSR